MKLFVIAVALAQSFTVFKYFNETTRRAIVDGRIFARRKTANKSNLPANDLPSATSIINCDWMSRLSRFESRLRNSRRDIRHEIGLAEGQIPEKNLRLFADPRFLTSCDPNSIIDVRGKRAARTIDADTPPAAPVCLRKFNFASFRAYPRNTATAVGTGSTVLLSPWPPDIDPSHDHFIQPVAIDCSGPSSILMQERHDARPIIDFSGRSNRPHTGSPTVFR